LYDDLPVTDVEKTYEVKGRLWITNSEATFLGYGRIVLLERIKQHGSISAAARSMGMGYRHAWRLVASMNRESPVKLVVTSTGGRRGGGAVLTEAGEKAIQIFWQVYKDFQRFLAKETKKVNEVVEDMKRF
jgi:molybdate transport system regulatory protein